MASLIILSLGLFLAVAYAQNVIVPGATWTDTSGNVIQAHGAGMLKVRARRGVRDLLLRL